MACWVRPQGDGHDAAHLIYPIVLQSTAPISPGVELCASYCDSIVDFWADRQGYLLANYNFTCACFRCSIPLDAQAAHDQRTYQAILNLDDIAKSFGNPQRSLRDLFKYLESAILLLIETSVFTWLEYGTQIGFLGCVLHGDEQHVKNWALLSLELCQMEFGNSSPRTAKAAALWKDPKIDVDWGRLVVRGDCQGPVSGKRLPE